MKIKFYAKLGDFAPSQSSRTVTPQGYLICTGAKLSLAPQVRPYYAAEFPGLTGYAAEQTLNVFTAPEELFKPEVLASFEGVELTNYHPPGNVVNAATWRQHVVGSVSNVRQEGSYLIADLLIKDGDLVNQVQSNEKVELSIGYGADLVVEAGAASDGTPYQAKFINFQGNHVALVPYGRCGGSCRIGDQDPKQPEKFMKVKVGDMPFDVADNPTLEAAINRQNEQLASLQAGADTVIKIGDQSFKASEAATIQVVVDKLVADAKAVSDKVAELEANQVTPEKLQKMVADQAAVIDTAKKIKPDIKTDGCSCEQIKRDVVTAKAGDAAVIAILGGVAVADAKPEQIDTVFRVLAATSGQQPPTGNPNPLNSFTGDGGGTKQPVGDGRPSTPEAYDKSKAWKNLK